MKILDAAICTAIEFAGHADIYVRTIACARSGFDRAPRAQIVRN